MVEFVTAIERLELVPDAKARVVVNERTGTVVMGAEVKIMTIAVAHGNLSIQIRERTDVSQPLPFSQGQTVAGPDTAIEIQEESSPIFMVKGGTSIGELVRALNALGVSPRDLIAIFQAIKAAGALQAELEVI
jgi:flagellar P-ring protein precursor FlgI